MRPEKGYNHIKKYYDYFNMDIDYNTLTDLAGADGHIAAPVLNYYGYMAENRDTYIRSYYKRTHNSIIPHRIENPFREKGIGSLSQLKTLLRWPHGNSLNNE